MTRFDLSPLHNTSPVRSFSRAAFAFVLGAVLSSTAADAQTLPEIRITPHNQVPACVTTDRLTAFLKSRNRRLIPRFQRIADWYQHHGERWRVRWDYAFYQMALETNFLTYRQGNGRMGDVDPAQNNFAGLGTTGGGVPGDRFADVSSGVLGHIQHLVVYSGERLEEPTAPRTVLKQDEILKKSWKLARTVRFSDLARRWAVDPKYARSIEWVAKSYRKRYCSGRNARQPGLPKYSKTPTRVTTTQKRPPSAVVRTLWRRGDPWPRAKPLAPRRPVAKTQTAARRPAHLAAGVACTFSEASYGGKRTVLLRTATADQMRFTALSVLEGFETSMTRNFVSKRMPNAEVVGTYPSKTEALLIAQDLCPR